jgi:hypothetical protein
MTQRAYHITQRPDGRWEGRRQGFQRVSILHTDRKVVEERIKSLAEKHGMPVFIQGRQVDITQIGGAGR